jgi:hypothetical protein
MNRKRNRREAKKRNWREVVTKGIVAKIERKAEINKRKRRSGKLKQ